jgi:hypothetical protein
VKAAGNTNETTTYNTSDINPLQGVSYYRIKSVDVDGKVQHTNTVEVTTTGNGVVVYPNPAQDVLNVSFAHAGDSRLELYSVEGRLVFSHSFDKNGAVTHSIDISTLPAGVYLLKVITGNSVVSSKITKL